jgi:hypothetical protein
VLASLALLLQWLGNFKVLLSQQISLLGSVQLVLLHLLQLEPLLKALFKCLQGVSQAGRAIELHEMCRCTHAAFGSILRNEDEMPAPC